MSTRDEDELSHTELTAQYRHSQSTGTECLCWVDASSFTAKVARTLQCEVVDDAEHECIGVRASDIAAIRTAISRPRMLMVRVMGRGQMCALSTFQ